MAAANPEMARINPVASWAHPFPPPSLTSPIAISKLKMTPPKQASRHGPIEKPKMRINQAAASKETGP
jgi:hypothetical protein